MAFIQELVVRASVEGLSGVAYPKRAILLALLALAFIAGFEVVYRLPELLGESRHPVVADVLSSHRYFSLETSGLPGLEIGHSFLNWLVSNIPGMFFGLLMGSVLLALVSLLPETDKPHRSQETALGILTGIPLGVCVNCAAPMAKGMLDSGSRPNFPLALMLSSPVFNIVVLSMTFSLFPVYLGAIRYLLLGLFFILLFPLILNRTQPDTQQGGPCALPANRIRHLIDGLEPEESWLDAASQTAKGVFQGFAFLMRKTAGWMVLAGVLGVTLAYSIPLEHFIVHEVTGWNLLLLALIATLLPVPMAFDVLLAHSLYAAGLPAPYVAVLLLTLGTYSLFPLLILWTTRLRRMAIALYAAFVLLGVLGGSIVAWLG